MRLLVLMLGVMLVGCGATIQTHERVIQDTGRALSAYVGGQVLKVARTQDLPNAFGRADLFGGKINRGYTELRYQGLAADGRLIFRVTEVETESSETTMSRYGGSTSTLSAQRVGNRTVGILTYHDAPRGSTEQLPPNITEVLIDLNKTKAFSIGGVRVLIINATETSLEYQLAK
jgi:hypothetical protein